MRSRACRDATDNDAGLTWRRAWPFVGLTLAFQPRLWIGALGYAVVRLL